MSSQIDSIEYCPIRTNIDWSKVDFVEYPNQEVQVADYSKVEYFRPSDSEGEQSEGATGNGGSQNGVKAEDGSTPHSPTTPISSRTAKNKAKKAKQKAREKAKKAAVANAASGASTPVTPATPLSPMFPKSPATPLTESGVEGEAATPKSKSKNKKKKKKSKKSDTTSETNSPPSGLATAGESSSQDAEPAPAEEPTILEAKEVIPEAPAAESEEIKTAESTSEPAPESKDESTPEQASEQTQISVLDESAPTETTPDALFSKTMEESSSEPTSDAAEPIEEKQESAPVSEDPVIDEVQESSPEVAADEPKTTESTVEDVGEVAPPAADGAADGETQPISYAAAVKEDPAEIEDRQAESAKEAETSESKEDSPANEEPVQQGQDANVAESQEEFVPAAEEATETVEEPEVSQSQEEISPANEEASEPKISRSQEGISPAIEEASEPELSQIQEGNSPANEEASEPKISRSQEEISPAIEEASEPKISRSQEEISPAIEEASEPKISRSQEEISPAIEEASEPKISRSQEEISPAIEEASEPRTSRSQEEISPANEEASEPAKEAEADGSKEEPISQSDEVTLSLAPEHIPADVDESSNDVPEHVPEQVNESLTREQGDDTFDQKAPEEDQIAKDEPASSEPREIEQSDLPVPVDEEPVQKTDVVEILKDPSAHVAEGESAPIIDQCSASVEEEISAPVVEEGSAPIIEQSPPVVEESSALIIEEPSVPVNQDPAPEYEKDTEGQERSVPTDQTSDNVNGSESEGREENTYAPVMDSVSAPELEVKTLPIESAEPSPVRDNQIVGENATSVETTVKLSQDLDIVENKEDDSGPLGKESSQTEEGQAQTLLESQPQPSESYEDGCQLEPQIAEHTDNFPVHSIGSDGSGSKVIHDGSVSLRSRLSMEMSVDESGRSQMGVEIPAAEVEKQVAAAEDENKDEAEEVADKGEVSPASAFDDTPVVQADVGEEIVASNPVDESLIGTASQGHDDVTVEKAVGDEVTPPPPSDEIGNAPTEDHPTEEVAQPTVQEETTPEEAVAKETAPEEAIPQEAAPEEVSLKEAILDEAAPQEVIAEDSTPAPIQEPAVTVQDEIIPEIQAEPAQSESQENTPEVEVKDIAVEPNSDSARPEAVKDVESAGAESEAVNENASTKEDVLPDILTDESDKSATGDVAVAAGSLLVAAPAVMEATREHGNDAVQTSQDDLVRDISDGIPNEPSAHDLPPPYSPSPDAATSVESAKKALPAGSQYGTFTSDQQKAQAPQDEDERERLVVASGAESSASSKDKVVKDEVVTKPSATSSTSDTLESPDEPGPVIADNNDPVVQEGKQIGSGVGDEERGDHVEEAVVRVTDQKEIATHFGITDGTQPVTDVSVPEAGAPSLPLIQQPGDEKDDNAAAENLDLSSRTRPPQENAVRVEQSIQPQTEQTEIASIQISMSNVLVSQEKERDEVASASEDDEEACKQPTSPAKADDRLQEATGLHPATTQILPISSAEDVPVQEPNIQPPSQAPDASGSSPEVGVTKSAPPELSVCGSQSPVQPNGYNQSLDVAEAVETGSGTVGVDQYFHEVTEAHQIDNQSQAPSKVPEGDTFDHLPPHMDSDKPIERHKDDQEDSDMASSNQDLMISEASQEPAQPAPEKQAPTIDSGFDTPESIPERQDSVSSDSMEPQRLQQDRLQIVPPGDDTPHDLPQEDRQPGEFPQEDNEQWQAGSASEPSQDRNHLEETGLAGAAIVAATAAGIAVHKMSSVDTDYEKRSLDSIHDSMDKVQKSVIADKATETLGEEAPAQRDIVDEVRPISSAELHSPQIMPSQDQPPFSMVVRPSSHSRHHTVQGHIDKPSLGRADSSTQTDEPWRPVAPVQRGATPGDVQLNLHDKQSKGINRARSMRRRIRRNSRQVGEVVAVADTVDEKSASRAGVVKDLKQQGDATAPSNLPVDGRGKESPKADDKVPRSPRAHRSSHSSRSDRPSTRDGPSKDGGATRSSHHRRSSHRLRVDGEREFEQNSPRTPPRRRDTAESSAQGSHSSRSRRERTPQEQADHDRRKEERHLAREKEKEREDVKPDSPAMEAKGKEAEGLATADRSLRSSRRYSSSRNTAEAPAAPVKKFFTGESILQSNFGGPLTADAAPSAIKDKDIVPSSRRSKDITRPPPAELKRSNTSRSTRAVRQSVEQSNLKSQRAREQDTAKPSKEKSRKREGSSSPVPSNGFDDKHRKSRMERREKEEKDEKKKSSGGIKGMFKKLFSS